MYPRLTESNKRMNVLQSRTLIGRKERFQTIVKHRIEVKTFRHSVCHEYRAETGQTEIQ